MVSSALIAFTSPRLSARKPARKCEPGKHRPGGHCPPSLNKAANTQNGLICASHVALAPDGSRAPIRQGARIREAQGVGKVFPGDVGWVYWVSLTCCA